MLVKQKIKNNSEFFMIVFSQYNIPNLSNFPNNVCKKYSEECPITYDYHL